MIKLLDFIDKFTNELPKAEVFEDHKIIKISLTDLNTENFNSIKDIDFNQVIEITDGNLNINFFFKENNFLNESFSGLNFSEPDFKEKVDYLKEVSQEQKCIFSLIINKNKLISKFELKEYNKTYIFLYQEKALNFIKNIDYKDLNQYFNMSNFLIILDFDIFLTNPYFKILGGKYIEKFLKNELDIKINNRLINSKAISNQKRLSSNFDLVGFIPDVFYFEDNLDESGKLIQLFNNLLVDIIFINIANDIEEYDDSIQIVFNGYKKIKIKIKDNFLNLKSVKHNIRYLVDLYDWVYNSRTIDKIEILRNVITLNLKDDNVLNKLALLEKAEQIKITAENIFNTHIKENIEVYFQERKQIEFQIYDIIKDLDNEIKSVMKLFSSNILGVAGTILAILISYISKTEISISLIQWIIFGAISFIIINTTYYTIFSYISKEHLLEIYNNYIISCKSILTNKEIKRITGEISKKKSILKRKSYLFNIYIIANILISLFLIFILYYISSNISEILSLIA